MKAWVSLVAICTLLGGLLSSVYVLTNPSIQVNRQQAQRVQLAQLSSPIALPELLLWQADYLPVCTNLSIQRLRANGYGGVIQLLLAYHPQPCSEAASACRGSRLARINVVQHSETPGIGDFFATRKPNWLTQLTSLSGSNPKVDAVSGATITANAIRRAVAAEINADAAIPFASGACNLMEPAHGQ